MKFLKTLQKKQIEKPFDIEAVDNVVPQNKVKERRVNKPPEIFNTPEAKIGRPNPTFNTQSDPLFSNKSDSLIEVLTPEVTTENFDKVPLNLFVPENNAENGLSDSYVSIAIDPERVNPRVVAITQSNSAYCEEYRGLRTHILHKSQKQKLQSIVVASINPSEGKSITALNLAWLLAQTDGIKALVVDSDLRRPSLAQYLGIETKIGLSEVLENKFSIAEAIIKLEPAGLHLLPGGESRFDVAELISGQGFKEILSELREMFDYVIIDAPPLGVFSDATVLINHADAALLVVRANHTRYKDAERILEMLPRERMIGAVLNQSDDTLISDSYSYYNYNYEKQRNR